MEEGQFSSVLSEKKKTLDNFVNRVVGDDRAEPLHVAFGAAKFASTGRGEHYASPSSLVAKLIRKRVGPENYTFCNELNTFKVCHRFKEPLNVVGCKKKR